MSKLSSTEWRDSRRALMILKDNPGLTLDGLAERLGVPVSALRRPVAMLIGRGLLQRCDDYLVMVTPPQGGGQS